VTSAIRPTGVVHQPLRDGVVDQLRQAIVAGRFAPGERLFEDQIADELEVSRNPVREALQALAREGFVELEPRRGARVATISRTRVEELFELRESLEGLVARLAAVRRTDAQLAELESLVATGTVAAEEGRLGELPDLNTRFHELLAEQLHGLRYLIEWVYARRIRERSARSWFEHVGIVEALAARDEQLAFARACAHIANARAAYFAGAEPA
jgi:DNA-binding GntR family transcriptional regulator